MQPRNERPKGAFHGGTDDADYASAADRLGRDRCAKCGAVRVDKQIGLESRPDCLGWATGEPCGECYVCHLVDVFRAVRRVLRDDGTLWVVIGDSYNNRTKVRTSSHQPALNGYTDDNWSERAKRGGVRMTKNGGGIKEKDLMMVPARLALALQADGWTLRSEIIWSKKSCMPESVRDRPARSHETIYLFSKGPRYYFDAEAVREESTSPEQEAHNQRYARPYDFGLEKPGNGQPGNTNHVGLHGRPGPGGRNIRSVWHLGPEPFAEAHFAVFPTEIPRRAILAGTSERGCCPACGAGWVRRSERPLTPRDMSRPQARRAVELAQAHGLTDDHIRAIQAHGATDAGKAASTQYGTGRNTEDVRRLAREAKDALGGYFREFLMTERETTGWSPACACPPADPVPCVVLDPFSGAGTTLLVAERLGRDGVGIELNERYAGMAKRRVYNDAPLFANVAD